MNNSKFQILRRPAGSTGVNPYKKSSKKMRSPSQKHFKEDSYYTEPSITLKPVPVRGDKENYMADLNNTLMDVQKKLPANHLELKRASPVRTTVFSAGSELLMRSKYQPMQQ